MSKDSGDSRVSNGCRVLSCERVMNLQENFNIGFVVVDITIASIDKASNGRLRDPSNCLIIDGAFDSIENVNPVAEDVLDISASIDLMDDVILPRFNLGKFTVIPLLDALHLVSQKANSTCQSGRRSEIVSSVAESFEELVGRVVLVDGGITVIFLRDFDVGLEAFCEHGFHFRAVGFPNDNAEIG